jgi:DNA-binding HxlR family transcriptional regulator
VHATGTLQRSQAPAGWYHAQGLADALKRLECNGLISRRVLPTQAIGVEYTITAFGGSLRLPFAALYNWSLANGAELERAQKAFDATRQQDI